MKTDGAMVLHYMEQLMSACEVIEEGGACDRCPCYATCLEDSTFMDVVCSFNASHFDEMFALAEDISDYMEEQSMESYYADMARKDDDDPYY